MKRAIVVLGMFALVAQVLCLRQLAVAFHGTEIYFGAALGAWLMLTAAGSSLLGRFADGFLRPIRRLGVGMALAGVLLPLTVVLLRWAPRLLPAQPGAVVPFWRMCLVALPCLAPLCVLIGFLFALACRVMRPLATSDATAIARAYVLEAAGTVLGGVIFSYGLVRWVPGMQIAAGAGLLMIIVGAILLKRDEALHIGSAAALAVPGVLLLALLMGQVGWTVDFVTKKLRMPGYTLLASRETPYGQLDVGRRDAQRVFFSDGAVVATTDDVVSAEEVGHFALLVLRLRATVHLRIA